jgi:hypothetical protein
VFLGVGDVDTKEAWSLVVMEDLKKTKYRLDPGQFEVLDDAMAKVSREKTPAERIQIGFTIWTSARNMLIAHIKNTHPEWNPQKIEHEAAKRLSHGTV